MRRKIMISVDEKILDKFDRMAEERCMSRSKFVAHAMKNEVEKWE
ncbi:ribbon-helix-helix protein, CopG family [Methanococcoides sp. LMO-2]|uniref:Ribbon-helix-helix protein, CopG family n=1 Tax=Methanococcoides cohabitans TaxID=3136559 RepID=A0ABU9KVM0_9EURY